MMKVDTYVSHEVAKKIILPLLFLVLGIILYCQYTIHLLPLLSPRFAQQIEKYLLTGIILSIGFMAQRGIGALCVWYRKKVALETGTPLDEELVPLLRRFGKVVVWIIVSLIVLPMYGVNVSALIATLGVSSLAIALAAQDTISNIIAGFMIMIDRPFKIGDKIKLPTGEIVKVLDVGVRRSKFFSDEQNAVIILPNLDLSKGKIINFSYGEECKDGV